MALKPLPIDPHLPEILGHLETSNNLVIQSSPGSGKTTRVPPALLNAAFRQTEQEILVLVPRRLAAKMAALRVAEERGEKIGGTVGYQFRFENVSSPLTRLKFLTEGLLLRQLMSDPLLSRAACVILDEFHERHLHSDVALSYLRHLQKTTRPDLRLVVMSATLDTAKVSLFLENCPIVDIKTKTYPVALKYFPVSKDKKISESVADAVGAIAPTLLTSAGDALVFLPGMADILRSADELERRFPQRFNVLPLHGELAKERQSAVFEKSTLPKIILSTNVAETSLTIDGVTFVIDSGLHRQASYSWWSGVPALKTKNIAKASAIQRAGRAGRTAPGTCIRLYGETDFNGRPEFDVPEIRRSDLAQTLLEIKALGIGDLATFSWFENPKADAVKADLELLFQLGALDCKESSAKLTEIGLRMAKMPLHPRLSRVLMEAQSRDVFPEAARIVSLIAEGELEYLDVFEHLERPLLRDSVKRQERMLLSLFNANESSKNLKNDAATESKLSACLLRGFPDRVAKKRMRTNVKSVDRIKALEADLIFSFGGSGTVSAVSLVEHNECFIVLDVQERQGRTEARPKVHVSSLCPIAEEELLAIDAGLLQETESLIWDEKSGRVKHASQLCYGALTLSESLSEPSENDAAAASKILLQSALGIDDAKLTRLTVADFLEALRKTGDPEPVEFLLTRLELARSMLGAEVPDFVHRPESYAELLRMTQSRADFSDGGLAEKIFYGLTPEIQNILTREFPEQVTLAGGRRVKVRYEWGKDPWIASRLQDFFGMKEGPQLARGRVPVTLHLLAPNQRAVQVTKDLKSFWQNTYPEIRHQLARRYPRHQWPESV